MNFTPKPISYGLLCTLTSVQSGYGGLFVPCVFHHPCEVHVAHFHVSAPFRASLFAPYIVVPPVQVSEC